MRRAIRVGGVLFVVLCCLGAVSCVGPSAPSIVGKWQSDSSSTHTLEFFSDGTWWESQPFSSNSGRYALLEDGRLQMETDALLGGTKVGTFTYSISGDRLTMTAENTTLASFLGGDTLVWIRVR